MEKNPRQLKKLPKGKGRKKCSSDSESKNEINENPEPRAEDVQYSQFFQECTVNLVPLNLDHLAKYANKRTHNDTFGGENRYPKRKRTKSEPRDSHVSQYIGPFDVDFLHSKSPSDNCLEAPKKPKFDFVDHQSPASIKRFMLMIKHLNVDILENFSNMSYENVERLLKFIFNTSFKYLSDTDFMNFKILKKRFSAVQKNLYSHLRKRIYKFMKKTANITPSRDLNYAGLNKVKIFNKYKTKKFQLKLFHRDTNKHTIYENVTIDTIEDDLRDMNVNGLDFFGGFDVDDVDIDDESYEEVLIIKRQCIQKDVVKMMMNRYIKHEIFKQKVKNHKIIKNYLIQLKNIYEMNHVKNRLNEEKLKSMELAKIDCSEEDKSHRADCLTKVKAIENSRKTKIDNKNNTSDTSEISSKKNKVSTQSADSNIKSKILEKTDGSNEDKGISVEIMTKVNEIENARKTNINSKQNKSDTSEKPCKKNNVLTQFTDSNIKCVLPGKIDCSKKDKSNSLHCLIPSEEINNSIKVIIGLKNNKSDIFEIPGKKDGVMTEFSDAKIKVGKVNKMYSSKEEQKCNELFESNISVQNKTPDQLETYPSVGHTNCDKPNSAERLPKVKGLIPLLENNINIRNNKVDVIDGSNDGREIIELNKNKINENDSDNNQILQNQKKKIFSKKKNISILLNNKKRFSNNADRELVEKNIANGEEVDFYNHLTVSLSTELLLLFYKEIYFNKNINIHDLFNMAVTNNEFENFSRGMKRNILDFSLKVIVMRYFMKMAEPLFAYDVPNLVLKLYRKSTLFIHQKLYAAHKNFELNVKRLYFCNHEMALRQILFHGVTPPDRVNTSMQLNDVRSIKLKKITGVNTSMQLNDVRSIKLKKITGVNTSMQLNDGRSIKLKKITGVNTSMQLNDGRSIKLKKITEDTSSQTNEQLHNVATESSIIIDLTDDSDSYLRPLNDMPKTCLKQKIRDILGKHYWFKKFLAKSRSALRLVSYNIELDTVTLSDELIKRNLIQLVHMYVHWVHTVQSFFNENDSLVIAILQQWLKIEREKAINRTPGPINTPRNRTRGLIKMNRLLEKLYALPSFATKNRNRYKGCTDNYIWPHIRLKNRRKNQPIITDLNKTDYSKPFVIPAGYEHSQTSYPKKLVNTPLAYASDNDVSCDVDSPSTSGGYTVRVRTTLADTSGDDDVPCDVYSPSTSGGYTIRVGTTLADTSGDDVSCDVDNPSTSIDLDDLNNIQMSDLVPSTSNFYIDDGLIDMNILINGDCTFGNSHMFENNIKVDEVIDVDAIDDDFMQASTSHFNMDSPRNEIVMIDGDNEENSLLDPQQNVNAISEVDLNLQQIHQEEDGSLSTHVELFDNYLKEEITVGMSDERVDVEEGFDNAGVMIEP